MHHLDHFGLVDAQVQLGLRQTAGRHGLQSLHACTSQKPERSRVGTSYYINYGVLLYK